MIKTKQDLRFYLNEDKKALGKTGLNRPRYMRDDIWRFQIILRKHEYYENKKQTFYTKICKKTYAWLHRKYGLKLGFSIPINVFGAGLRINHHGLIVVNPNSKIGMNCDIHQGVNIGQNLNKNDVPRIGNDVWIGPGAKLFGKIEVANGIVIGANAVVNKSFLEEKITIAGMPAKKIKDAF